VSTKDSLNILLQEKFHCHRLQYDGYDTGQLLTSA